MSDTTTKRESSCCGAKVRLDGGSGATRYNVCCGCGKACDVVEVSDIAPSDEKAIIDTIAVRVAPERGCSCAGSRACGCWNLALEIWNEVWPLVAAAHPVPEDAWCQFACANGHLFALAPTEDLGRAKCAICGTITIQRKADLLVH